MNKTPQNYTPPHTRDSKKNKNTYTVRFSGSARYFGESDATPLQIVSINGQNVENSDAWARAIPFPNPATHNMVTSFAQLKTTMGEKLASTIIEYLDKDTFEPAILLFPTGEIVYDWRRPDFIYRLNHASRRDLQWQRNIRKQYMNKLRELQK